MHYLIQNNNLVQLGEINSILDKRRKEKVRKAKQDKRSLISLNKVNIVEWKCTVERKVEVESLETQTSPVLKIKGHNF